MPLDLKTTDHICNVIRREVQSEFRHLHMVFIAYEPGRAVQALNNKRPELYKYCFGKAMFEHARTQIDNQYNKSAFIGLHDGSRRNIRALLKPRQILSTFFVNTENFDNTKDLRQWCYREIWHIFDILKQNRRPGALRLAQTKKGIILPRSSTKKIARANMLGDVFGAIIQNFHGNIEGHIATLSKQRCREAMEKIIHHNPALYPFPIAEEAAQIVYEDLYDDLLRKQKPLTLASDMATEIGHTFDEDSIKQWRNFADRAQEMAWMGFDTTKILSAAIYTSEDTYVRSIAYLVAEILNLTPPPIGTLKSHNPFLEQESSAREHIRQATEYFRHITKDEKDNNGLRDKAKAQNQALLEGSVMGWCAHALLETHDVYNALHETQDKREEETIKKFKTVFAEIEWRVLVKLRHIILRRKRNAQTITPDFIIDTCAKNKGMELIAIAMKNAPPALSYLVEDDEQDTPDNKAAPEQTKAADDNAPAALEIEIDRSFS